jgi:hypothetical protein
LTVPLEDRAFAELASPGRECKGAGFDTWIAEHAAWRAEEYGDLVDGDEEPEPKAKPNTAKAKPNTAKAESKLKKLKPPVPDKSFLAFGTLESASLAPYEKRIAQLLKPEKLSKVFDEGVPENVFLHRGTSRAAEVKAKCNRKGMIYVIDGDLVVKHYLELMFWEEGILYVTGNLTTTYLRVGVVGGLHVGGNLKVDYLLHDSLHGTRVAGKTEAKGLYQFGSYDDCRFGKVPKGVFHDCWDHETIKDDDADVVFKRMIKGKRFLFDPPADDD